MQQADPELQRHLSELDISPQVRCESVTATAGRDTKAGCPRKQGVTLLGQFTGLSV